MWLAILLTTIFGLIFMGLGLWGTIAYVKENGFNNPMSESEFRYKKLKQQPDGIYYSSIFHYETKLDEVGESKYNKYCAKVKKFSPIRSVLFISLPVIIFVMALIGFASLGAFIDNENLKKDVEQYKIAKYTIEQSLSNEQLDGLERIDLLKQVQEKNEWLARKKYEVSVWYNWHLDDKIVLELEFIELKG